MAGPETAQEVKEGICGDFTFLATRGPAAAAAAGTPALAASWWTTAHCEC